MVMLRHSCHMDTAYSKDEYVSDKVRFKGIRDLDARHLTNVRVPEVW